MRPLKAVYISPTNVLTLVANICFQTACHTFTTKLWFGATGEGETLLKTSCDQKGGEDKQPKAKQKQK